MKYVLSLLMIMSGHTVLASADYSIRIDDSGYRLKMNMIFSADTSLGMIRQGFKNSEILSQLSPNVQSVTNTMADTGKYDSLMVVKSFGISSELLSKCEEQTAPSSWTRSCQLQTDQKDGGQYMEWKKDEVSCKQQANGTKLCEFLIEGKAKPLTLLGIPLLDAKRFSVKAKYQAMGNFFKLYYFIHDGSLSARRALALFSQSPIHQKLDAFAEEASNALKKNSVYESSYSLGR